MQIWIEALFQPCHVCAPHKDEAAQSKRRAANQAIDLKGGVACMTCRRRELEPAQAGVFGLRLREGALAHRPQQSHECPGTKINFFPCGAAAAGYRGSQCRRSTLRVAGGHSSGATAAIAELTEPYSHTHSALLRT